MRRRSQFWVGRVRSRLARMVERELTADGWTVRVDPSKLWPNQGYWRIDHRADCMPWNGQFEREYSGRWQRWSIGSWDTMTSLLRGFTYDVDGWSIELSANHPRVHPWMARRINKAAKLDG